MVRQPWMVPVRIVMRDWIVHRERQPWMVHMEMKDWMVLYEALEVPKLVNPSRFLTNFLPESILTDIGKYSDWYF